MMFVLTDKKTGGVYAVNNIDDVKTVHMFQQKEDAQRYMHLLEASNYSQELDLMEIDVDAVAVNCEKFGYQYSIVSKNDLIIPPIK